MVDGRLGGIRLGESSGAVPGVSPDHNRCPGVTANGSHRRYLRADDAPNLSVSRPEILSTLNYQLCSHDQLQPQIAP